MLDEQNDHYPPSAQRALVTGVTGYVGYHLAITLMAKGWEVHSVVRPQSDLTRLTRVGLVTHCHEYDGSTASMVTALERSRPDVVFHLAAHVKVDHRPQDVESIVSTHVLFGTQLIEAMALTGSSSLVNAGTYFEYDSDGKYAPNSLYAANKRALQDVIIYYCLHRKLRAITLVLFDIYGPRDWRPKLINQLVAHVRGYKTSFPMTEGFQELDLVHVTDVVDGMLQAALLLMEDSFGFSQHRVFLLDSGARHILREIVQLIERLSGTSLQVQWGALPYRENQIFTPIREGVRLPGWSAQIGLEEGLRQLLEQELQFEAEAGNALAPSPKP